MKLKDNLTEYWQKWFLADIHQLWFKIADDSTQWFSSFCTPAYFDYAEMQRYYSFMRNTYFESQEETETKAEILHDEGCQTDNAKIECVTVEFPDVKSLPQKWEIGENDKAANGAKYVIERTIPLFGTIGEFGPVWLEGTLF